MSADGSPPSNPFDRVRRQAEAAGDNPAASKAREDGELVSPVPDNAPRAGFRHGRLGEPSMEPWAYRAADGQLLGYVARFDKADGGKDILPRTLWRTARGLEWRWKGFAEPRPLYGLPRLADNPEATVLVVEGEKTVDAAQARFPALAVTTWPGGSKAVGKADFAPLRGRTVVIWPDADKPGEAAANAVRRAALSAGASSATVVAVPGGLRDGWDLGDPWPSDFGPSDAARLVEAAIAAGPADNVVWPLGYRMTSEGLFLDKPAAEGKTLAVRLSACFEVVGEARDPDGGGWAVVIRFRDRDGRLKTQIIPKGQLASSPGEVRAQLASEGLFIASQRGKADSFAAALAEVQTPARQTLVNATGWASGDRFVLPSAVIGPAGAEPVLFTGDGAALHYRTAGTLTGWRDQVAARASGNSLLLLALSIAFAGPLLRPLGLEGGGFHFRGPSSCGKTTLGWAGGSVWGGGGPLGAAHSWRATANALEMIAYGHSETLLVLDELGLVAPEEAGQAAYSLASGQAKARSKTDGALRRRSEWRAMLLSTGEISLADHIRASRRGERPMAGQELRLLDIAADGGGGLGVWETLHGAASPAEFSDAIKAGCGRHYGHAGPTFVRGFIDDREAARAHAKDIMRAFLAAAQHEGDTGQVHRAAHRFALVAAAGELAAAFGVTPWAELEASNAALTLFNRWASAFGRTAPREELDVLRTLRGALEMHVSRFGRVEEETGEEWPPSTSGRAGEARSLATLGFRHVSGPEVFYLFHDAGWREVFKGFDPHFAARTVLEAGFLEKGDGNHMRKVKKVRGQPRRFFWVRESILGADLDG